MKDKSGLSDSLSRLLRRGRGEEAPVSDWTSWFASEKAAHSQLMLHRADGASYASQVLRYIEHEGDGSILLIDALLPAPEEDFWHQPVSLHGEIRAMEGGVEEIVTFTASVGERVEHEGRSAVELTPVIDLLRTTREYVAEPGNAYPVELGLIWMGAWFDLRPDAITISRLFFDAPLEGEIGPDGYAVPKATLRLEPGTAEVPVQLTLKRSRRGGFEAIIERIDGTARQKLVAIIEEIWRIEAGLSTRRVEGSEAQVGYRSTEHDPLAEAFEPHSVLLGASDRWAGLLRAFGPLRQVEGQDLEAVSEAVAEGRTDLIVGDADAWGDRAVQVERLLRSVSRFRNIPRIWFTSDPPTAVRKGRTISPPGAAEGTQSHAPDEAAEGDPGPLDLVDFGAWDLIDRDLPEQELRHRLRWALGEGALGEGEVALLVSTDRRLRYRLGLAVASARHRLTSYDRTEGLVQTLTKRRPAVILLDATRFEVEIESLLAVCSEWTRRHGGEILVLARGADHESVANWLRAGARDIILLDPALRDAARRLNRRLGGGQQAPA